MVRHIFVFFVCLKNTTPDYWYDNTHENETKICKRQLEHLTILFFFSFTSLRDRGRSVLNLQAFLFLEEIN